MLLSYSRLIMLYVYNSISCLKIVNMNYKLKLLGHKYTSNLEQIRKVPKALRTC